MDTRASLVYAKAPHKEIVGTLAYLSHCCKRRDAIAKYPDAARQECATVSYTNDPVWLINMAINRKANWPDDPSCYRGSAMPILAKDGYSLSYPKKAQGDEFMSLWRLSRAINGRVLVRVREVPKRYRARLAHRLHDNNDF